MKKNGYFLDLLKLDVEKYPVIAVVGGGGKTSLIYRLNEELQTIDKKVIISTTTHMAYDPTLPLVGSADLAKVPEILNEQGFVAVADIEKKSGKMCSIEERELKKLVPLCNVMLIEADGAKRKPLKVPADWEPVIPEFADVVISVIGLDCLDRPICEIAHRAEDISAFLKKNPDAPVTAEDIEKIATSVYGLYKNVDHKVYRVYLNKVDVLPDPEPAEQIVKDLTKQGTAAACGSLKEAEEL
ncbi:MAG: selenium cofactor biosynthesis protein YqeC [Clostridia bacterium]|nr:selenium cofactor biosynthesis protein YqeC [Clostridia bacterium]